MQMKENYIQTNFGLQEVNLPSIFFQVCTMTDILHEEQLKLQLSELEMLRSMYPTQEEFAVREVLLLNTQRYLDGKREAFPNQLEYTITIRLESGQVRFSSPWHAV